MPKKLHENQHLVLRSRDGDQVLGKEYRSAEVALSLAITSATRHESKEGSWTILEWGEPSYRVTKDEHGDCLIEVLP